jgi:hypothetical protein
MRSTNGRKVSVFAVIIGGSAMVAMGAMSMAITEEHAGQNMAATGTQVTVTATTPPSTPAIAQAVPAITGKAPLWAGEAPDTNPQQ